jgi:nitrogen fixation protein NifB
MSNQILRDKVAVASYEGILVNQHLGMASHLFIYRGDDNGYHLVDSRPTPPKGGGEDRWKQLCEILSDCRVLLVNGIGDTPCEVLTASGITVCEIEGLIEDALGAVHRGEELRMPRRTRVCCKRSESGDGGGEGCG